MHVDTFCESVQWENVTQSWQDAHRRASSSSSSSSTTSSHHHHHHHQPYNPRDDPHPIHVYTYVLPLIGGTSSVLLQQRDRPPYTFGMFGGEMDLWKPEVQNRLRAHPIEALWNNAQREVYEELGVKMVMASPSRSGRETSQEQEETKSSHPSSSQSPPHVSVNQVTTLYQRSASKRSPWKSVIVTFCVDATKLTLRRCFAAAAGARDCHKETRGLITMDVHSCTTFSRLSIIKSHRPSLQEAMSACVRYLNKTPLATRSSSCSSHRRRRTKV